MDQQEDKLMNVYEKMNTLNIEMQDAVPKGGIYSPVRLFQSNMAFVSGTGPIGKYYDGPLGKLGSGVTLEQGRMAARSTMLNILFNLHHNLGDLGRIKSFVKILAFVASADTFTQQPKVIDGASEILLELFGPEIGMPARSAIAANVLPGDIPVEIEVLLELH